MAKLRFRYGAMGASKSADALMVRFNYMEKGMSVIMLKPACENRDGSNLIKSRIGLSAECISVEQYLKKPYSADVIIVDEVQFLNPDQIDKLAGIVDHDNIPVLCYGLRTDFQGHLFPGSKRLMELADVIEEVPTICWCGHKAHFNARIDSNGKIVREGNQMEMGGNERYISLCRKHFISGKIFPNTNDDLNKK